MTTAPAQFEKAPGWAEAAGECPLRAVVLITTRNRVADLRKAVQSAVSQSARPEVLVIDDGSSDGTAEIIQKEFPGVKVHKSPTSFGYIVQRNRGANLSKADILFSIDDDAAFSSPFVVEQTLKEFSNPRIGAVAIPFVDVNQSPEVKQAAPDAKQIYATYSYIGTAHAIRRQLFVELGGYREHLIHQGEEEDYCLRMLNEGFITRCGNSDPVHHFESPKRSLVRMDYYGSRNKILFTWENVPFPYVAGHLAVTSFKTVVYTLKPGRFLTRLRAVLAGYAVAFFGDAMRQPVSPEIYLLSRELKARKAVPLGEIEQKLSVKQSAGLKNEIYV
ncbi:MAG: glycosyltransferase family A protein [Verrucomicrobiota bacterium]|nr:glycosyltransferase family A protein [Verrucomicrobiota bacterium]